MTLATTSQLPEIADAINVPFVETGSNGRTAFLKQQVRQAQD